MNVKRLETLAEFLKTVPEEQFNMYVWAMKTTDNGKVACGYAACAMGWACMIPEFRKAGLVICNDVPHFHNICGLNAASEFFDISYEQTDYLFSPDEYNAEEYEALDAAKKQRDIKTEEVINRIEELINEENANPTISMQVNKSYLSAGWK